MGSRADGVKSLFRKTANLFVILDSLGHLALDKPDHRGGMGSSKVDSGLYDLPEKFTEATISTIRITLASQTSLAITHIPEDGRLAATGGTCEDKMVTIENCSGYPPQPG